MSKSARLSTTQYLCASCYADEHFCDYVLQHVLIENRQALAPCYGIDLAALVRHCLIAKKTFDTRDNLFTFLFALAAVFSLIGGMFGNLVIAMIFLAAVVLVYRQRYDTRHNIVQQVRRGGEPDTKQIKTELARYDDQLKELETKTDSTVVIYGRYLPFVGCGYDIGGWSLSVNTQNGKEVLGTITTPKPFEIDEMYQAVTGFIDEIRIDGGDIKIENIYYIDGHSIRDDHRFLVNPFERALGSLHVHAGDLANDPLSQNRFYKRIQITSWNGEIILSIVLRLTRLGKSLFIEAKYFLLSPIQEGFHRIDNIQSPPTTMQKIDLAWQSLILTFFLLPLSFARAVYSFLRPLADAVKEWIYILIIKESPSFNYGSLLSVRENVSGDLYRQYFQILDKDMYIKIVENGILEAIVTFLDGKDIDTSDLKSRQSQILNEGIIMSGGEIKAKNFAVGRRARAIFNRRRTIEDVRKDSLKRA